MSKAVHGHVPLIPPLYHFSRSNRQPHLNSHLPATREIRHQSRQAHFQMLYDLLASSLQEYEEQTGITLSEHPLAEQLRYSDSAESVTAILQNQLLVAPYSTQFR